MRPVRTLHVTVAMATLAMASPALAQPSISVNTTCAPSERKFMVTGSGFKPSSTVYFEVLDKAEPAIGARVDSADVFADAQGNATAVLDTPLVRGFDPLVSTVRASIRPPPDQPGEPVPAATTTLTTISKGVTVQGDASVARHKERWIINGLPEGTTLYAHYRLRGKQRYRRRLGTATGPCGMLRFTLRLLPKTVKKRPGTWTVHMTPDRTFDPRRKRVFIRRKVEVDGSAPNELLLTSTPVYKLE